MEREGYMAEITVIVPVYNVARYLPECVESILRQTFQDYELLLVDDGSDDGSSELCDRYAQGHPNIRVLRQPHSGVSAARNRGIAESRSGYIVFVDSDDYVDSRYLEILYQAAIKYDADLVASSSVNVLDGSRPAAAEQGEPVSEVVTTEEAYRRILLGKVVSVTVWANIYRKSVLENVRFPVGEIYEDNAALAQILDGCGRIVCSTYAGYYYRIRRGSIMHGRMSAERYVSVRNAERLLRHVQAHYPKAEDAARIFYINNLLQLTNLMVMDADPQCQAQCRAVRRAILRHAGFFLLSRDTAAVEKGAVLCLVPGIPFYRLAWHVYLRVTGKIRCTILPEQEAMEPGPK